MANKVQKTTSSKNKKKEIAKPKIKIKTKVTGKIINEIKEKSSFYIVGIGTSAGGLEALELFFNNCPSDTGLAFIIVQHLSPDYKSLMPELLSRHTKMKVNEAKAGVVVEPNHIYLMPGSKNLTISKGRLRLTKRSRSTQMNFSIDIFFHSLAAEQKERAIGIILSGTGSDGTRGGKSIKEVGGTIFVQNPEDSRFNGMPRSAINGGLADFILTCTEMPGELIQFLSHPQFAKAMTGVVLGKNLESIDRILKILKNHTGYDFFSYKKPTLLRRTAKRMNITKCESVENYIDYLYEDPNEKFTLVDEFLIGVTKFFRDPVAYQILEKQVIPDIVEEKRSKNQAIKIWVVACSTGEEAYSIAILFEEYLKRKDLKLKYKIFATDIDGKSIDVATKGIYSQNIKTDVSQQRLSNYFIRKENNFQIQPSIRKNIIFSKHDILQHPPFNKMDLISCRNMLIYIDNNIQLKVLSSLHYALNHSGYLFMGSSESIGILNKNFSEVSSKWKIYRNILPTKLVNIGDTSNWRVEDRSLGYNKRARNSVIIEDKVIKSINKHLMTELEAVCVCIDEHFEIIYASGKFKQYVTMPEEGFSNNILKILSEDLILPITTAVRKLNKDESETIVKDIKLVAGDQLRKLRLRIKILPLEMTSFRNFLITIIEKTNRPLSPEEKEKPLPTIGLNIEEVVELREALNETRENLQATIEELETSNEEMQATNEEMLASNEELQSTNEELQSLNEELHTVNAELQEKNLQLLEANSDIENLMVNTNIGTIFLDRDFNIRKFTPEIKEHFHLRTKDIGRPISHFSGKMGGNDLIKYSEEVLKELSPFRLEFQSEKGLWFLLQIFPYQSQDNIIKGVVVNFININQLKKATDEKIQLANYITHLTDSSPMTIYLYDVQKKANVFSSKSIWELAGYTPKEIQKLGNVVLESFVHPDDYPKIIEHRSKIETIKDNKLLYLEYRIIHRKTKKSIWILSAEKVHERGADGKVKTIVGTAQDISQIKSMEDQIKQSEERSRLAVQGTGAALWEWSDLQQDNAWWSPRFYDLLGYSPKKLQASYGMMLNLIHPNHIEYFQEELKSHLNNRATFEVEMMMMTNKRGYRWYRVNVQADWDSSGNPEKIVGTLLDIDDKYQFKQLIEEKQARLSAIYDNAPIGILLINTKGKIKEASQGVTKMLGYKNIEIFEKHFTDITFKEDVELSKINYSKLLKGKTPFLEYDKRYITKDNIPLWCNIIVSPITISTDKKETFHCIIMSNISKRKASEHKMQLLNQELERFAYLASHDLKEPLRTITSLTERLKEKHGHKLDKSANKYIEFIEEASIRMQNVTSGLLIHSELGRKIPKFQPINLNQLIKQIRKDLDTSITENKATIEVKRLPKILGDPMQIGLLFQNLISNSVKYRKKKPPIITIGYENKGDHWEFFVKDNGIGIAKENQDKVFEVFRRLHNKNEYEGLGIGLSSCKRIVENHHGKIWIRSTLRRGATFFFSIPKKHK